MPIMINVFNRSALYARNLPSGIPKGAELDGYIEFTTPDEWPTPLPGTAI